MQETPQYSHAPQAPLPPLFPTELPKKRSWRPLLLGAIAGIVVIVGVAAALLLPKSQDTPEAVPLVAHSMKFYYRDGKTVLDAPAFEAAALEELESKYGSSYLESGAWKVTTTLDRAMQQSAREMLNAQKAVLDQNKAKDAAFIAEDATNGQIVAWVGGYNDTVASKEKVVDNLLEKTEVGTLAVPLTYAAVIENSTKYGAGTELDDSRQPLESYPCTNLASPTQGGNCAFNFDYSYVGKLTLRQALGAVRLVPTIKAAQEVGFNKVQATSNKIGSDAACYLDEKLEVETACYGSSAFGDGLYGTPASMVQAYATLANSGSKRSQTAIVGFTVNGRTLSDWKQPKAEQVIRKDTAYIVSDILADATATYMQPRKALFTTSNNTPLMTVSGTSMAYRTAAFVQASPKYVAGMWAFGNDGVLVGAVPETSIAPGVYAWMDKVHTGDPTYYSTPNDIQELVTNVFTVHLGGGQNIGPSPVLDIYPKWYK